MVPTSSLIPTIVLAGPTAAGKTELALRMAALRPGQIEIINADSMQVYRGMDVGTAKPSREELAAVRHHLIDIREPHEPFTAGEFRRAALAALGDIHARGKRALIVGGTGFYLRALFFGIWDSPAADPGIRARLEVCGLPELYARLEQSDPQSALRIGPADRYRLTRALEIIEQSGRTPSELEDAMSGDPHPGLELWVVDRDPEELERRLSQRIQVMLEQGFIEEVERLLAHYPPHPPRALGAVGYREVHAYLTGRAPAGRKILPGLPGLRQELELAHRQLVKKQRTWFRNLAQRLGSAAKSFELPDEGWKAEFDRLYQV